MIADAPQRFVFSLKNILLLLLCLAPPLSVLSGKGSMGFMFFGMWVVFSSMLYAPVLRMRQRFCAPSGWRANGIKVALVAASAVAGCVFGVLNDLVLQFTEWYAYRYEVTLSFSVVSPPYHILLGSIVGALTGCVAVSRPVHRSGQ